MSYRYENTRPRPSQLVIKNRIGFCPADNPHGGPDREVRHFKAILPYDRQVPYIV
jgi:hypothetical protein